MPQTERIPPHNTEAEFSVLGAILIDSEVFFGVTEILQEDDFYSSAHKEIFAAMMDLFKDNQPIDLITVSECLTRRKSLEAVGGRAYIAELTGAVPTSANAVEYAKIVKEKAVLRRLIHVSSSIVDQCYTEKLDSSDVLNNAESAILDIAKERQSSEYSDIKDVLSQNIQSIAEAQKNGGVIPGLPTGFKDLDKITTGLQKSDLIIVAARPSMGKTAFALNIAQSAAIKNDARVLIFSLEMSKTQLGLRMLAMESRVDSQKLRVGDLSNEDWKDINHALDKYSQTDIIIDDTPGISVMEIRNKCRRLASEKKIDLIMIDYIQMMTSGVKNENRVLEVGYISRQLKLLAREMECPVIVLSQLSRAVDSRQGSHKPMLSDLRESGSIEQDADVVMFLYRDDYYKDADEEKSNTCEVIIAKQRNGSVGSVMLTWLPKYTKFADRINEE